jgi:hypothetical protein
MDKSKKQKAQAKKAVNVLESLKDIGSAASESVKEDLIKKAPKDIMEQLLGPAPQDTFSGEISAGESLEFSEIISGQHEEKKKLEKQLVFERRLREEEKIQVEKKTNELRIQLTVLMEELSVLSEKTQDLGQETKIAAMQAPVEPGVYHIIFFEKLIEFIKSFRKKIEEADVWLHATNKRASKKNAWGARYKKYGAKYLLSGEHYLTRSAG